MKLQRQSLPELDASISRVRAALASGEASEFAQYQLAELLEIRRKLILGRLGNSDDLLSPPTK